MAAGPDHAACRASRDTVPASKSCARSSRSAPQRKVRYLTLFAFSSENWLRPAEEVGVLMGLFLDALVREVADLHRNQVRLRFIGDRESLGLGAEAKNAGCGSADGRESGPWA